jgi:hypothetical protein
MALIDPVRVHSIMMACLFKEEEREEPKKGYVDVTGINIRVGFHPERLKSHKDEVLIILKNLPETFLESKGGGWTFLNACIDREGEQWGQHSTMNELLMLGLGLGLVRIPIPREAWGALPGGMPYFTVLDVNPRPVTVTLPKGVDKETRKEEAQASITNEAECSSACLSRSSILD